MKKFLFVLLMMVCGLPSVLVSFLTPVRAESSPLIVDRMLILMLDSSSSMNDKEWRLQVDGTAEALRSADVVSALTGYGNETTAVTVVEWSGTYEQRLLTPWIVVREAHNAHRIAQLLQSATRRFGEHSLSDNGQTAIGSALSYAVRLAGAAPFAAKRVIIDISSDGKENSSEKIPIPVARAQAEAKGFIVNALPIAGSESGTTGPELLAFYEEHVIVGEYAFVNLANGFGDYHRAIRVKIASELSLASR